MNKKTYDIAAYIWPAYTGAEPRTRIFWPDGIGEWQTVKAAKPAFKGSVWPRVPLLGYADEADPSVMERQIDIASAHGVNVFIYDWYWYDRRPFLEQCLNDGFLKAENRDKMKFYLMWANHDATHLWDTRTAHCESAAIWSGKQDFNEFKIIVRRVIEKYFTQANYYTIEGKPVFSIYEIRNMILGLGGIKKAVKALEYFRAETVKAGFPGLHLQGILHHDSVLSYKALGEKGEGGCADVVAALGLDSVTHYQQCVLLRGAKPLDAENGIYDYGDWFEAIKKETARIEREYEVKRKIPYFPHVSLGWDTNIRFPAAYQCPNVVGNTPAKLKKAFEFAKTYADTHINQPPLITVNSWNEWTESSYLLPDDLNGYGYLEAVKDVF